MKTLKVIVQDTNSIVYEGEADRVTSFNEIGKFDIFPMHANFISIIRDHLDVYLHHEKVKEIPIQEAVMKVKGDMVHIFLGIETLLLSELDPASIKKH